MGIRNENDREHRNENENGKHLLRAQGSEGTGLRAEEVEVLILRSSVPWQRL